MGRWARPTLNVATIDDVARLAGVSPATVSRVVNIEKNVREATRQRVCEAVRELNYVPNLAARSLASAGQVRLGVVYNNPSEAYLSALLIGAMEESAARGVMLLMVRCEPGDDASESATIARLRDGAVNGVLLPAQHDETSRIFNMRKALNIPTVAVGAGASEAEVSCVHVDDRAAAFEMTAHLLDLGHRRIGFIKGHPDRPASRARTAGFEAALATVPGVVATTAQGFFTFESGLAAAEQLLSDDDRPTAIFASNDAMAAAVISVAQRQGLVVPRDLTVVGFDDTQIAVTQWPPLTTVRQPVAAMAAAAIELLLDEIRAGRDGALTAPVDQVLPHVLIQRSSCAPPRAEARPRPRVLIAQSR